MPKEFSFFPIAASTVAQEMDVMFWVFTVVCGISGAAVFAAVLWFAWRYRQTPDNMVGEEPGHSTKLEIAWSIFPGIVVIIMALWGAKIYVNAYTPPASALEVIVTGKQWMWKIQHPSGRREINELHVPIGRAVKLTMTSEDVLHSFYVPAFRVKRDVLPGYYTQMWFEATKVGEYHLFCAEYCGTEHSLMIGRVVVMEEADYHDWLTGGGGPAVAGGKPLAEVGAELFQSLACVTCHAAGTGARGPQLDGLFGRVDRPLEGGGKVAVADETYIRESILNPMAKVAQGFQPIMPTFEGRVTEDQIIALIAYVKTLGGPAPTEPKTEGATK